jgi:hypothetical protein
MRTIRHSCLYGLVATLFVSKSFGGDVQVGCLYAESGPKFVESGCNGDLLHLADQIEIKRIIEAYSLARVPIRFVGCTVTDFFTGQYGPTKETRRYEIHYPLKAAESSSEYLAPVAHELFHVYQLEMAGDEAQLKALYDIKRIELAADYMTGVVSQRLGTTHTPNTFQINLRLVGRYSESTADAHGTPEERVKAFRFGFYDPPEGADWRRIHKRFQDNVYGDVVGY